MSQGEQRRRWLVLTRFRPAVHDEFLSYQRAKVSNGVVSCTGYRLLTAIATKSVECDRFIPEDHHLVHRHRYIRGYRIPDRVTITPIVSSPHGLSGGLYRPGYHAILHSPATSSRSASSRRYPNVEGRNEVSSLHLWIPIQNACSWRRLTKS